MESTGSGSTAPGPERSRFEAGVPNEQAIEIAGQLQELVSHPSWPLFRELLAAARIKTREEGFAHPEEIQRFIGFVSGLTAAEDLPVQIIKQAEEYQKRAEAKGRRVLDFRGSLTPMGTPGV